ncbi:MAG: ArsR family transcriptional regulator [Bacteroidales bacterium]|nr:ArsR family transcriptional regulator [Bacteroidales bacterium]
MLDTLITSKTRLKLLVKFFLNASTRSYLRDLEAEFGESTNGIRVELNRFEEAGMLVSHFERNKKIFAANTNHPLFNDIHNLLLKYTGIDEVVQNVLHRLGGLEQAWLVGDFARGRDGGNIELVLVGETIDQKYLIILIEKAQVLINRQIVYRLLLPDETRCVPDIYPERLLLYVRNL